MKTTQHLIHHLVAPFSVVVSVAAVVAMVAVPACKKVEEKRIEKSEVTAKSSEASGSSAKASGTAQASASPHGQPGPHGGMGSPVSGARASLAPTSADGTKVFGPFSLKMPKDWKETPVNKPMRLAQWAVGEPPVELVAYHFPGGGSVDSNIDRWVGQFKKADGSAANKADRKDETIDGLAVTTVSVSGHYVAAMMPGQPGNHDAPNSQLLGAIITTDAGRYFLKMVGPKKTVAAVLPAWNDMVQSIKKSASTEASKGSSAPASAGGSGGDDEGGESGGGW